MTPNDVYEEHATDEEVHITTSERNAWNAKADNFDLVLKLARFHALSYGRNNMTYEDYEFVSYLENERQNRVSKYVQVKSK